MKTYFKSSHKIVTDVIRALGDGLSSLFLHVLCPREVSTNYVLDVCHNVPEVISTLGGSLL